MTVDEYVAELEATCQRWAHRMEAWELSDVKLQIRIVKRDGRVRSSDIFLLKTMCRPKSGQLGPKYVGTKTVKKVKPVPVVQASLF